MATLVVLFVVHSPSLLSHSFSLSAAPASGSSSSSSSSSSPWSWHSHRSLLGSGASSSLSYGRGAAWEWEVRRSATPRWDVALSVFVTGARGDGMLGHDNFYSYYDPALKRARQWLLASRGVGGCDAPSCAGLGGRDAPSCAGLGGRVKGGRAPSRAG